jgi:hypothetical protein
MFAALEAMRGEFSFEVEVVDIDACPEKLEKFDQWGTRADFKICHYFLDEPALRRFFDNMKLAI